MTVKRLSLYLGCVEDLLIAVVQTVNSRQLAEALGLTAAQVRKDLATFGQFGRPGVGYRTADLVARFREILGTDHMRRVAVVGVGSLGRALLRYKGFLGRGFRLAAAFDSAESKVGRTVAGVPIRSMNDLATVVQEKGIRLVVLAVPAESAQDAADALVAAEVRGILNFAPVRLNVPDGVSVVAVDLAVQLEQLSYLVGPDLNDASPRHSARRHPKESE